MASLTGKRRLPGGTQAKRQLIGPKMFDLGQLIFWQLWSGQVVSGLSGFGKFSSKKTIFHGPSSVRSHGNPSCSSIIIISNAM